MKRTRRKQDGFTLLEVMITLAVMLVAVMGIVSLERAAIRSNGDSRATSTASANNARWSSIIRRTALTWTTSSAGTAGIDYLSAQRGAWVIPTGDDSFALDWYGQPTDTEADFRYCTLLRIRDINPAESLRVDIVTFWGALGSGGTSGAERFTELCAEGNGADAGDALFGSSPDTNIRHVRSSIVVRRARP